MVVYSTTIVLILLVGYWLAARLTMRKKIFPGPEQAVDMKAVPDGGESIWLQHDFGRTELWLLPAAGAGDRQHPLALIAHGQKGSIDTWTERLNELRSLGYHCALLEYPGYGRSSGECSEANLSKMVVAAYDKLAQRSDVDRSRIVGVGRSMGGAVIMLLASQRKLAGVWLMSTFTSLRPFFWQRFIPWFALSDQLNSLGAIRNLQCPVTLIHGTEDSTVPSSHSVQLSKAAGNPKLLLEPADHTTCPLDWSAFWQTAIEHTFDKNR